MILYFGEITDEYGTPSVASYGQVNLVTMSNRVNDRVLTIAGETINAGVGFAPADVTASGAISWGNAIATYYGITGNDYTSLVGHKLSFFTSQSIDSKLPFSLSFLNIQGTSSIHCFFGNLLFGVGYNFQWNAADSYGHDFYCVMNDDFDGLSFTEMTARLYNRQFSEAQNNNFLDMPCFPDFAPFYFIFGYSQWLTLNAPSSTIGTTLDFFGWHTQGLNNASNWAIMLYGSSGSSRRTLELKDEIAGITEIVLAEPVYMTSRTTSLYTGYGFEDSYADEDIAVTYDRYIAGTDLSYLRKLSGNAVLELKNGAYINNDQNRAELCDNEGGSYVTNSSRYSYSWLDDTTAGVGGGRGLYLMVTPEFADITAMEWLDIIPDTLDDYSIHTCPLQLVSYGLVGAVSDYDIWSNTHASTLLSYTPTFRYNGFLFGNVTYNITVYYNQLSDTSVVNKEFWEVILENLHFYQQEIDIGEDSIGGGYSSMNGRGGQGTFDDSSDEVHSPGTSITGGAELAGTNGTGLFKMYVVDGNDLITLSRWLSETDIWNDHSEYVNCIISVKGILTPDSISHGSDNSVLIGNKSVVTHDDDATALLAPTVTYQYERFTLGSFTIPEYYGSFMDYAPHTSIRLYLPFAGCYDIDPSVVVGTTVTLTCMIDYMSGNLVYNLDVLDEETGLNSTMYTFNGNCSFDVPITYEDYNGKISSYANAFLGVATTALSAAVGGPVGGAVAVGAGSTALKEVAEGMRDPGKFGDIGMIGKNNGFMSPRAAHLIIKRPRVVTPETYAHDVGWPCEVSGRIGEFSGFTAMKEIHLDGITATDSEIAEIDQLLRKGVIV